MKAWWNKWAERIDAMVLRERVVVFFAAGAVLVFLFQAILSGPVTTRQREVARQLAQKLVDTRLIQEQAQAVLRSRAEDPDAASRQQVEDLRKRVAELDARLAQKQSELLPPDQIPGLLEEMLRRERKLELVDLQSLPPVALFEKQAETGNAIAAAAGAAPTIQVYRHGVELTVRGSYFDLVHYLDDLEQLPLRMFWREVDIAADEYPIVTMKLSVYTLSLDRHWVVV